MGIKYVFKKDVPQKEQDSIIKWHALNVEQDVYVKSIRHPSKNVWIVTYKSDGITTKELEKSLWDRGYFRLTKKDKIIKTELI